MDAAFCVAASAALTGVLEDAGITISMDGRGRCKDNIFIERLWRSMTGRRPRLMGSVGLRS